MLQLDDFLVALRTAKAATTDRGISCSIDPTEEGLKRLRPLLKTATLNEATVDRLEQALGPQQVTVTGVPASSHFAHVLVAADFVMKRLGMNFEHVLAMPNHVFRAASLGADVVLRKDAAGGQDQRVLAAGAFVGRDVFRDDEPAFAADELADVHGRSAFGRVVITWPLNAAKPP